MPIDPLAGLTPLQRNDVQALLREHAPRFRRVVVFGSRARGSARYGSDLDLAIFGADEGARDMLFIDFDDSDLTLKVDVIDYDRVGSDALRQDIDRDGVDIAL